MNKFVIVGLIVLFFAWIIYLRMQKDKENYKERTYDEEDER